MALFNSQNLGMVNKVLVIGGGGYIGLKLVKKLVDLNLDVTVMSRNISKFESIDFLKEATLYKGDITKIGDVQTAVENKDCIINLAAMISKHDRDIKNPIYNLKVNCEGQLNVLESLRTKNPECKYIFVGSRAQFGRVAIKDLPIKEDYPKNPISLYGIHKQTAEEYCHLYKKLYDINSIIIRPVGVYGPGVSGVPERSVLNNLIKKAIREETIKIYGYGDDIKDFLHINDLTDLFWTLICSNIEYETFNIGCGEGLSFYKIGEIIVKFCEKGDFQLTDFPEEDKKFEMGSFVADITKVTKKTEWSPNFKLSEGIKQTVKHYSRKI